jgi:hypothetical protein
MPSAGATRPSANAVELPTDGLKNREDDDAVSVASRAGRFRPTINGDYSPATNTPVRQPRNEPTVGQVPKGQPGLAHRLGESLGSLRFGQHPFTAVAARALSSRGRRDLREAICG